MSELLLAPVRGIRARRSRAGRQRTGIPPFILFLIVTFSLIVLASLLVPVWHPIDPAATDPANRLAAPVFLDRSSPHLLGTDNLGRDVAMRMLYATRSTILISFSGMLAATCLGSLLGVVSGLCGGMADHVISFLTDVRLSIPTMFIGVVFACVMGASPWTIILVIAVAGWSGCCRIVRSQVIQLKQAGFMEASRAMGASGFRILREHILVNIASPLIVQISLTLSEFILLESALSFLGLGVQPPDTSLGAMISVGRDYMLTHWWLAVAPSMVIVLMILQISLTGDWLRDRLDPNTRR